MDLVKTGTLQSIKDCVSDTPCSEVELFTYAVYFNKPNVVEYLINQGVDVNAYIKGKYHPIHYAKGLVVLKQLISHGATVNASVYGFTPLHCVVCPKLAKELLDHGADVNARDVSGNTPLHNIVNRYMAIPYFADYVEDRKKASSDDIVEVVRLIISHGADVNATNDNGCTPLHNAGDPHVVELLLNNGAYVDALDVNFCTPMHYIDDPISLELLITRDANVNAVDDRRCTPLHYIKDLVCVKLLLDHGANVNAVDNEGFTPLHNSTAELTQLLLDHGADPNIIDNYGDTALSWSDTPSFNTITTTFFL